MLETVAALVALVLAAYGIRLAWQTAGEMGVVRGLVERAEASVKALTDVAADQAASLSAINENTAALASAIEELKGLRVPEGAPPAEPEDDDAFAESPLMTPVALDELDDDVRKEVTARSGAELAWALRRRGPGAPRWLVGTDDGRAWRATRWKGINVDQAFGTAAEHGLERASFDDLHEKEEALAALARALVEGEQCEALLSRLSRGVPVYYVFTDQGRILRLVRTRWGWGVTPEESA